MAAKKAPAGGKGGKGGASVNSASSGKSRGRTGGGGMAMDTDGWNKVKR